MLSLPYPTLFIRLLDQLHKYQLEIKKELTTEEAAPAVPTPTPELTPVDENPLVEPLLARRPAPAPNPSVSTRVAVRLFRSNGHACNPVFLQGLILSMRTEYESFSSHWMSAKNAP